MSLQKNGDDPGSPGQLEDDPHYDAIIYLPEVHVSTLEDDETILFQQRGKLFRHDKVEKEWKERGTGEVKLLHNEENGTVRVVMRRDKTLKICANHYVTPDMELASSCGSDRAWVWSTRADVADGEPQPEILALRFLNAEMAKKWKDKFEEAKQIVSEGLAAKKQSSGDGKVNVDQSEEGEVGSTENNETSETDKNGSSSSEESEVDDFVVIKKIDKLNLKDDEQQPVSEEK